MSEEADRSVTLWIELLKSGDPDAAEQLWRRYFEALVRLARAKLRTSPRTVADEEDAALSAFDSFFHGVARSRYPRLDDRDDLWRLLVVITERKALDQATHARRLKRGGGKNVGSLDTLAGENTVGGIACPEPSPEFAAIVADQCRLLLGALRDETLRQVALLKMEGYTTDEVAELLGCSPRSVARKLEIIRRTWQDEVETGP